MLSLSINTFFLTDFDSLLLETVLSAISLSFVSFLLVDSLLYPDSVILCSLVDHEF